MRQKLSNLVRFIILKFKIKLKKIILKKFIKKNWSNWLSCELIHQIT